MKCKKIEKLISEYLDDELREAEREAFESHVRDCRTCAERLREMQKVQEVVQAAPKCAAPSHFAIRVMASLEEAEKRNSWFDFFAGEPAYLKMAEIALAILIVILGAVSGNLLTSGKGVQAPSEIRSAFSLDVFDTDPPGSISRAYTSITRGNHE